MPEGKEIDTYRKKTDIMVMVTIFVVALCPPILIDIEKGNTSFEADLPDGMYTVKTFHSAFETLIQEFDIGKP